MMPSSQPSAGSRSTAYQIGDPVKSETSSKLTSMSVPGPPSDGLVHGQAYGGEWDHPL